MSAVTNRSCATHQSDDSAVQVSALQTQLTETRAAVDQAQHRADDAIATFKQQYPSSLHFAYGRPKYEKPFYVRSVWHDGRFTYIKSDAPVLPAIYEMTIDGSAPELPSAGRHLRDSEGGGQGVLDARQGAAAGAEGTIVMADPTPGTAPVVDHRTPPPGILPRHIQTWLMGALALGIVAIIVLTGRPQPASRQAALTGIPRGAQSGSIARYEDRLRGLETRAQQPPTPAPPPTVRSMPTAEAHPPAPPPASDPTEADRKRREYDSLFASNVVLSRRPDAQRLTSGDNAAAKVSRTTSVGDGVPSMPSVDDVADAVVRASARHAPPALPGLAPAPPAPPVSDTRTAATAAASLAATPPIRATPTRCTASSKAP